MTHSLPTRVAPQLQVSPSSPWVAGRVLRTLIPAICDRGGTGYGELLARLGLGPGFLEPHGALVPSSVLRHLWGLAEEVTGDALIGHRLGAQVQPYLPLREAPGGETLEQLFAQARRGLLRTASSFTLELAAMRTQYTGLLDDVGEPLCLEVKHHQGHTLDSFQDELCIVSNLIAAAEAATGAGLVVPLEIQYRQSPRDEESIRALWNAPVHFGAPRTSLILAERESRAHVPSAIGAVADDVDDAPFPLLPPLEETLAVLTEAWRMEADDPLLDARVPDVAMFDPALGWLLTAHFGAHCRQS